MTRLFTARVGSESVRGRQEFPASVVFQTPPVAAPAYMVSGFSGSIASAFIRPPTFVGPSASQPAAPAIGYPGIVRIRAAAVRYRSAGSGPGPFQRLARK